ncbi:hypothetical protein E2C01_088918 [Portunus trituberculatus]|uniref:Uncharacterized protein n=1 Tax=Portunus trituberculatus TaxID=210409 RepID=A0A5B7JKW2_PORTR|nr:hypothetical protein [Portunus trituberculatus]
MYSSASPSPGQPRRFMGAKPPAPGSAPPRGNKWSSGYLGTVAARRGGAAAMAAAASAAAAAAAR